MNAEALLAQYERIAEAPDAIARLRRFVLDLAVRGKLVPQNTSDGDATRLLDEAAAKKRELIKAGEIKKEKEHPDAEEDAPFSLPPQWAWTRLGVIASYIQRGKSPKYSDADGSLVISQKCVQWSGLDLSVCRRITLASLDDYEERRFLRDGDLLWNSTGTGTIGRVVRVATPPAKLVCDSHVTVVRLLVAVPEYIRTWLRTDDVYGSIEERAAGSTNQVELTSQMATNQVVPLPPLAEQHRIVAKIDELMALCDRLEAARAQREATRDRLTAATLARLNTPEPAASPDGDAPNASSFQSDARFALRVLSALTTRPDQIKRLRQTILNLAVAGRLVPQDPDDEPAESLLSKVRKSRKSSDRVAHQRSRLNLPQGWASAQLQDVAEVGTGLTPSKDQPRYFDGGNIPWINSGATSRRIIDSASTFVTEAAVRECRLKLYPAGSLLVALYGQGKTRGQVAELGIAATVNQALAVVQWLEGYEGLKGYVRLALTQQYESMREQAEGGPQPNLNVGKIKDLPLSVPPLAEQIRIVAKVDELMSLCDQLEASLSRSENTRSHLLNALLHETLHPSHDNVVDLDVARKRLLEKRQTIGCRIVERLSRTKGFGRTRAVKPFYWAEAHCGIALGGRWGRGNFGPYDQWIMSFESDAVSADWFSCIEHSTSDGSSWIEYRPGSQLAAKAKMAAQALDKQAAEFERVLTLLAGLDTDKTEIVTTLFAAWNDLLIEGKPVSDSIVITEMREHWHPSKGRFTPAQLQPWLDWLRQNDLIPKGIGPCTRQQTELL